MRSLEGLESRFVFHAFLRSFTSFGRISNDLDLGNERWGIDVWSPGGGVNGERVCPFCIRLVMRCDVLELSEFGFLRDP